MKINVKNRAGLILPSKAYGDSVGWDLQAIDEPRIVAESEAIYTYESLGFGKLYKNVGYIEYDTGLQIEPLEDNKRYYTIISARSSISNKNLILKNGIGIIEPTYRGNLLLRFFYTVQSEDMVIVSEMGIQRIYNRINQDRIYHKLDKIGQLIITEFIPSSIEVTDNLSNTNRGAGGFGSSS